MGNWGSGHSSMMCCVIWICSHSNSSEYCPTCPLYMPSSCNCTGWGLVRSTSSKGDNFYIKRSKKIVWPSVLCLLHSFGNNPTSWRSQVLLNPNLCQSSKFVFLQKCSSKNSLPRHLPCERCQAWINLSKKKKVWHLIAHMTPEYDNDWIHEHKL